MYSDVSPMRIATWNLERGGRSRRARALQAEVLRDLADVVVLTEPGPEYVGRQGVVTSPPLRAGTRSPESWIAILGASVEPAALEIPFDRMALAATARVNGTALVIYGSVLPWATFGEQAPDIARAGESSFDAFVRVLREQSADIEELRARYADHALIWAGDFNQHVSGPGHGGSAAKREALVRELERLGLVAWNGEASHAAEGLRAIDLICGPRAVRPLRQGRIDPVFEGVRMSDHAGYWVEV